MAEDGTNDRRLASLDALRGFDMLFLMGLSGVLCAISVIVTGDDGNWLARQLEHSPWIGFTQRDLIFPLFLFIAGISFPFSLSRQREHGVPTPAICRKIVRRMLTLAVLGLVYGRILTRGLDVTWCTVLGQIGFAWGVSALLTVFFGWRTRACVVAFILVAHTLVLGLLVAPDHPELSSFSRDGNISGFLDRFVFPNAAVRYYQQGLLSHVAGITTAMLGVFTGEFVRASGRSGNTKTAWMLFAAAALFALGFAWSAFVPVVKKMWTPSYALLAAAASLAIFAVFYWLIDVKRVWRNTLFLRVVGLNAITIYMLSPIVDFKGIVGFFLGGVAALLPSAWSALVLSAGELAIKWGLLRFLYSKKTFLKV